MKNFIKKFFLASFFFSICSELYCNSSPLITQMKYNVDPSKIMIDNKSIYVNIEGDWVQTDIIRCDSQGLYLFNQDIVTFGSRVNPQPKRWQCPYCYHWWELGEKCQNQNCPTNQWNKEKEQNS